MVLHRFVEVIMFQQKKPQLPMALKFKFTKKKLQYLNYVIYIFMLHTRFSQD